LDEDENFNSLMLWKYKKEKKNTMILILY
jgi:hypothetical protein